MSRYLASGVKSVENNFMPGSLLYKKHSELIKVSQKKLSLIKSSFKDTPDIFSNMSDQIVQVCMACLIQLINTKGYNSHYFNDFIALGDFDMSAATRIKYLENKKIIINNKEIEILNRDSRHSLLYDRVSHDAQISNSGNCYIATMVYGDYEHPQVLVLRGFRDDFLTHSLLGRLFILFYYKYSPGWVKALENNRLINQAIKRSLNQFIKLIK